MRALRAKDLNIQGYCPLKNGLPTHTQTDVGWYTNK